MSERLAVEVRDARLTYGKGKKAHHALRGVNLRVPEGVIYGLLGPSGCGKTTLLNSVIGKFHLKHGGVRVFGQKPGTSESVIPGKGVGFMPQELALYPEFTIKETLVYFGRLHKIDPKILKARTKFLLKFLDLPIKGRLVANLSGGQQRRVSFAAALIHRPPLLILDEPTVGVDPVLRQSIWDHLVHLTSKEGMTVIITTHYIEEARQANMVGLMRKGRLLAEASPEDLMIHFGESSLEDCFLKLCMMDKDEIAPATLMATEEDEEEVGECRPKEQPLIVITESEFMDGSPSNTSSYSLSTSTLNLVKNKLNFDSEDKSKEKANPLLANLTDIGRIQVPLPPNPLSDCANKIMTLFHKNVTRLRRNMVTVVFQFVLPTIQVVLLCICIGQSPFDLPVAVVNAEDPPSLSKFFLDDLNNRSLMQNPYPNMETALRSVKDGRNWGVIEISSNFSACLMERMSQGLNVKNSTIACSSIKVHLDMTNQQIGFTIQNTLLQGFQKFGRDMLSSLGATPLLADLPVVIKEPIYGVSDVSFTEFIAPGIILSITYIMAVGLTALSFVEERKSGLFDRSWVSGVTSNHVLISHILTQSCVLVFQVFGLLIFTFLVFKIPSRGPFIWVIIMVLLQGVCGMSYGLLISSLVSNESTAVMISLGSFYPNLIMSGIMWPIEGMPYVVRYVSYCLPQTLATEAVRSILSRGWHMDRNIVWSSFLVTISWLAFFLVAASAVFRFRR